MNNNDIVSAYGFPESISLSKNYINSYLLSEEEYLKYWSQIHNRNFNLKSKFPDFIFDIDLTLLPLKGGVLFAQQDFAILQKCMKATNDHSFAILEDYDKFNPPHDCGPPLRFKYPATISWEELCINDGISYELFKRPNRNFYVFGDSGLWGRYVANDYEFPLDIYGVHKSYYKLFENEFKIYLNDQNEVRNWLPQIYKNRLFGKD